jgi:hypothetical protein
MKSDEWEYPEDTWASVSHAGKSFDLNFWTDGDKKILTIYATGKWGRTDFNTFMSFELRLTEGDIKPILKALGIDDAKY